MQYVCWLCFLILISISCVSKQGVEVISGPGKIQVSPVNLNDSFQEKLLGSVVDKNITIKNVGGLPLTDLNFSEFAATGKQFNYQTGRRPGDPGSCRNPMKLMPGETCTFGVTFNPMVEGVFEESIIIKFNNGLEDKSHKIMLNGTAGLVANLVATESFNGNFGVHETGSVVEKTITIVNKGGLEARNFSAAMSGDGEISFKGGSYPGTGGTCATSLKYQETCTMVVVFKPTVLQNHVKQLVLNYKAPINDSVLAISLNAVSAIIEAKLIFLGGPAGTFHDFKKVTIGAPQKFLFTLVNSGYLKATDVTINIPAPYSISFTDCSSTLEISAFCTIEVQFSPTAKGTSTQFLTVNYNDGNSLEALAATNTGEGIKPADLNFIDTIIISDFDFGNAPVNGLKKASFLIRNNGDVKATSLSIASLTSPLSHSHGCGSQLLPGQNCFIEIYLKTTSVGAIIPQDLVLNFNNGVSTAQSKLNVRGSGAALGFLEMSPLPDIYGFGNIFIGQSSSAKIITLTNPGLGPSSAITPNLPPPFYFEGGSMPGTSGTCPSTSGFSLSAGTSCTMSIIFTPDTPAFRIFNMEFDYFNGEYNGDQVLYTFSGTGDIPASLVLGGASPDDLGNFSRNLDYKKTFTIINNGTINAEITSVTLSNNSTFKFSVSGDFPGVDSNTPNLCGLIIPPGGSCSYSINLNTSAYGVQTDTLTLTYETGAGTAVITKDFSANFADLGFLQLPADFIIPPGVIGGAPKSASITLTNTGSGPINSFAWSGFGGGFALNAPGTNCLSTIAPGASCTFSAEYTASSPAGSKSRVLTFTYDTGMDPVTIQRTMTSIAQTPANLSINLSPLYDYGLVVINTSTQKQFYISNSGSAPAVNVTLTGLDLPFSGPATPCGGTIAGNAGCFISVTFSPTTPGLVSNDTMEVRYNTGVMNTMATRDIKGTGETPPSNHGGWSEIYAIGNNVNVGNSSLGDKLVRLKWNDMTPTAGTITGYNIYRTTDPGVYDLNAPLASNISTSSKTYIDTSVSQGNVYYYMVRPIVYGFPSRILQTYGEVKVIAPPDNMTLGHRWMINTDMCGKLGRSPDRNNNHRCIYSGIGNVGGYYDIGSHLVVDRFELGSDLTSKSGQIPISSLTQTGALQACNLQSNITIAGSGSTFKKRVLSRKEWMAMASWPSTLNDTQITNREGALTSSTECNGSGSSLENTGNNTICVSRYGMENAAGNAWEWVSDRVLNGVGMVESSNKLDPNNKDFDNYDFSGVGNGLVETLSCLNKVIGIPRPLTGSSVCPTDTIDIMGEAAITFHNDYYWGTGASGAKLPIVGGSFSSSTYSGIYTTAWVDFNFNSAGTRCGFNVP